MAKKQELSLDEMLEQALVKDEDKPYEVSDNWVWTRLRYICLDFLVPQRDKPKIFGGDIPWCRIEDIDGKHLNGTKSNQYVSQKTIDEMNLRVNPIGTVICSCSASLGIVAIVTSPCCTNQTFIGLVCGNALHNDYLYYYLKSLGSHFEKIGTGTTIPYISRKKFEEIELPLPPIPEQQRIVGLIESLFEKLDSAKELVQNAIDSFENRKSAIQHKAFTGELTTKWREISTSKCFTEEQIINKNLSIYNPIRDNEIEHSIPDTWQWTRLGYICSLIADIDHKMPKAVKEGVKFLSAKDLLDDGTINFTENIKYISEADYNKLSRKVKPKKGDIIYSRIGARLGKARLVENDEEFLVSYSCCTIRVKNNHEKYVNYYLDSGVVLNRAKENVQSVGVPDLGLQKIKEFIIPIPPFEEQQEIVRILDELLENEQKAKELCDVIENIDHMKKSILARAFRGELSTNNPEEESALELLKEILREKAVVEQ